jgi:hypothetical protein
MPATATANVATELNRLFPHWMTTIGSIHRMNALLRSECSVCKSTFRENPAALAALHGPSWSIVGYRDRCRMVACAGLVRFKVSRTYGREWTDLGEKP